MRSAASCSSRVGPFISTSRRAYGAPRVYWASANVPDDLFGSWLGHAEAFGAGRRLDEIDAAASDPFQRDRSAVDLLRGDRGRVGHQVSAARVERPGIPQAELH